MMKPVYWDRPATEDGRGTGNFISSNFLYKPITLMKFRELFTAPKWTGMAILLNIHFVASFSV